MVINYSSKFAPDFGFEPHELIIQTLSKVLFYEATSLF